MIYCAGNMENFSFAKSIGVGLVESSISLTRSVLYDKPSEIVFVGTCGSYSPKQPLLEIFESTSACNLELSFLQGLSYTPLNNFLSNVSCETMQANSQIQLIPKSQKTVNSSNYISTDSKLAEKMVKLGILYENMEFFSVLQVAQTFELPALGIFCVTNHIHKDAQEEFLANHKQAKHQLESYIKSRHSTQGS